MSRMIDNQRGVLSIAALMFFVIAAAFAAAVLVAAKGELTDARHYAAECRVRFAAEGNADVFVKMAARGAISLDAKLGNKKEVLVSDKNEGGIRKRIYLKRDRDGVTVYSFADMKDATNGLKIFKQTKIYMERTDDGYAVKYKLP